VVTGGEWGVGEDAVVCQLASPGHGSKEPCEMLRVAEVVSLRRCAGGAAACGPPGCPVPPVVNGLQGLNPANSVDGRRPTL
jgi:hypothetical protein